MGPSGLRTGTALALLMASMAIARAAHAQSRQVTTPNVITGDSPTSVTLNGVTFTNKGIVGAGRLDANTLDFRGETLGSFSGMSLDLANWRRNPDGSYATNIVTLPDRGPFDGGIDYRDRIHTESITLRPLAAGSGALPQSTASQNQLTITPTGGFTLKDPTGVEFTGRDPGAGTVTRGGITYPLASDGTAAGHVSLDPEAIAFRPDGSFYVSDEYAAGTYLFNAQGTQIGAIQTVPALLPRTNGLINFNALNPGQSGRRNNQGLEAMALTPDNKKLVTILQSATVQDTNGANQQTRNNTRILVYDVSGNATPTNPIGHYVLQLPVYANNGSGTIDRSGAQSEMLALNDTQFLVLSRDQIGRGAAVAVSNSVTPVFKSILLVDTAGATNLAGSTYETGVTPLATNGALVPGIVPVQQVELINLLNTTQLARVGMNLTRLPLSTPTTLSEKIEAMALAPVLEEGAPQDFFLFVGNDNDFLGTNTRFNGQTYVSGGANDGSGNNDSVLLVYRLSLPTYVDPQALAAMSATAPSALYGVRIATDALAQGTTQPAMRFLNGQRGLTDATVGHAQLWLDTGWDRVGGGTSPMTGLKAETIGATLGLDVPFGRRARAGVFGGYRDLDGQLAFGAPLRGDAYTAGGYAAIATKQGLYAQAAGAYVGGIKLREVGRASAYGQTGVGRLRGEGYAASGELGWTVPVGRLDVTPLVMADYAHLHLGGYTERGASVSNVTYGARSFGKLTGGAGGELALRVGALRPALRGGYSIEREFGDRNAVVRLAGAQHAMGTISLPLVDTERDSVFGEARIAMRDGALSAYVSGRGRWGRGDDDARAAFGVSYAF